MFTSTFECCFEKRRVAKTAYLSDVYTLFVSLLPQFYPETFLKRNPTTYYFCPFVNAKMLHGYPAC